jgi:hypothetical protein
MYIFICAHSSKYIYIHTYIHTYTYIYIHIYIHIYIYIFIQTGHGEVRLSNVLPLADKSGLDPALELYVLDEIKLSEGETLRFDIKIIDTRSANTGKFDTLNRSMRRRHGYAGARSPTGIYIYMYTYIYIHICIYICVYTYIYTYIYTHL